MLIPSPADWWLSAETINVLAFLLTLMLAVGFAARRGLAPSVMYGAGVAGIAGALLGSRWWSAGWHWVQGASLDLGWDGSRAALGAFTGALLAGALYLRWRRESVLTFADAGLPAIAVGYAVARFGCLAAGDDFGAVTDLPWAVHFSPGSAAYAVHLDRGWIEAGSTASLAVHPVQLYHAALGLFGGLILWRWQPPWPGGGLLAAIGGYGTARFLLQYFRDEHAGHPGILDPMQWTALLLVGVALILVWRLNTVQRSAMRTVAW